MPVLLGHRSLSSFLFSALLFSQSSIAQTCYYPDGSIATSDQPCNTTTGVSTCCGQGYACLGNKVCSNTVSDTSGIALVRGSCTDQTWDSDACPRFCIGTNQNDAGGNAMEYCSGDVWLCDSNEKAANCTTGENTVILVGGTEAQITIGVTPSPTATSTSSSSTSISSATFVSPSSSAPFKTSTTPNPISSPSASPTPTPPSNSGISTGAKAGIGVAVPLGTILIAVLIIFTYRLGRKSATPTNPSSSNPQEPSRHTLTSLWRTQQSKQEIDSNQSSTNSYYQQNANSQYGESQQGYNRERYELADRSNR